MDSIHQSTLAPNKTKLARTFAKVLHIRASKVKHDKAITDVDQTKFFNENDDKFQRAVMDAFIAKVFATISSVKATYAQLQYAQSPYDADGIQSADQIMVSELKNLSELKQSFLKKHLDDDSPETTILQAEIREQKNLLQMYEITGKKLDSEKKTQVFRDHIFEREIKRSQQRK